MEGGAEERVGIYAQRWYARIEERRGGVCSGEVAGDR